jgi:DNA-binding transcriptional ArsR family regulator
MSIKDEKDDDTYSTVFSALKHPIRRRILRIIDQSPVTYTELLNELGVENGLLNYHLDSLRELVAKDEKGMYRLSEFGGAAVSLTQRIEEPRKQRIPTAFLLGLTSTQLKAVLIVLIMALGSVSGYFAYTLLNPQKPGELATAIVVRTNSRVYDDEDTFMGYNGVLRFLPGLDEGDRSTGEMGYYFIKTGDNSIEQGYLITGYITLAKPFPTFSVLGAKPFMSSTFAFAGSYVDVRDIGLSSAEQSLRLNLLNLGDQSIFWVRCWVNGTLLPYTFGVSRDSLINPSRGLGDSVYTSWIDPMTGTRRGVILKADESYPVHLELRYLDGSSRAYDTLPQAEPVSGSGLIVSMYGIEDLETDMVEVGNGNSVLSVSFRSTWIKPVTGMEILLDGKLVVAAP